MMTFAEKAVAEGGESWAGSFGPVRCPRLLNEYHSPGPGSGPGVHHNVVRQCLGVKNHSDPHQYEKKRCPE